VLHSKARGIDPIDHESASFLNDNIADLLSIDLGFSFPDYNLCSTIIIDVNPVISRLSERDRDRGSVDLKDQAL